jgi:DnaJ-class molecular chaperone
MKIYNLNLKRYISVEEGESLCSKCKGKGRIPIKETNRFESTNILKTTLECDFCLGKGKTDWVEITTKIRRFSDY